MKILSRLTLPAVLISAVSTILAPTISAQQKIGFIEDFALASDRELALKKLIPGTEDYTTSTLSTTRTPDRNGNLRIL